jgi:Ala-tRNA(Pro) deacylase
LPLRTHPAPGGEVTLGMVAIGWALFLLAYSITEVAEMAMLAKLREFLDQNKVPYRVHSHAQRFTAQEVAEVEHVPGTEVAKVVVLRSGKDYVMAVVPAPFHVDVGLMGHETGKPDLHLASEDEFADLFPGCEPGGMPPFGNLFGLPVWVDDALAKEKEIIFNAGNHAEVVHMAYADFARLVRPKVLSIVEHERK